MDTPDQLAGARTDAALARPRPTPLELCARACQDCQRACAEAIAQGMLSDGVLSSRRLMGALAACRELLRITERSLRDGTPFYRLLCEAAAGACTMCGQVCDALLKVTAASDETPLLKEVGDSCWITARVCQELAESSAEAHEKA